MRELWLIDETTQTVEVRRQAGGGGIFDEDRTFGGDESIDSPVFPTLRLTAGRLFAD